MYAQEFNHYVSSCPMMQHSVSCRVQQNSQSHVEYVIAG